MLKIIYLSITLLLNSVSALAAKQVTQTVSSSSGSTTLNETHVWTIEANKFSLLAQLPDRQISYIFNGRNLYACLKLTDDTFKMTMKSKNQEKFLREKLKKGVCFIAPVNIATSFYISPHNSISALDITDSLQLTLNLNQYKTTNQKTSRGDCKSSKRDFIYEYYAYTAGKNLTNSAEETSCHSSKINWRNGMWRQLSRTLLQQKSGRKLRKKVKDLKLDSLGLGIEKSASYDIIDAKKSLRKINLTVKTSSTKEVKVSSKTFVIPFGFELLTTTKKQERIAAKKKTDSSTTKGNAKPDGQKAGEQEDSIIPQILRTFIGLPF